jgi:hypothetical protein
MDVIIWALAPESQVIEAVVSSKGKQISKDLLEWGHVASEG